VTEVTEEEVLKQSEGGDSWETAYWVVYIEETITKELDNANINQYDVPINPLKLQDFSKHYYGRIVPDEVN
jgi:hypothetical protein